MSGMKGEIRLDELDALPPEKLSAMFESAIESLTDFKELERMQAQEKADKDLFFAVALVSADFFSWR